MLSVEDYKKNPCKVSSIPYWKAKSITIPPNMKIVHDNEFDRTLLEYYADRRFFRFAHSLTSIPEFPAVDFKLEVIPADRSDELADVINRSYTHSDICVSADYVKGLTETQVYCPELWLGALSNGKLIGSILCDFDSEIGEAIIEWMQVLPEYRGKGIATALVCRALKKMRDFAEFATVSGECENCTNPEKVYRSCGFEGDDVWHILSEKS